MTGRILPILPLALALGCSPNANEPTAAMYLALGDEDPVQIFELGLEAEARTDVIDALGTTPDGLTSTDGTSVRVVLSPDAETTFIEAVLADMSGRGGAENLNLLFGSDDTQIGLLLPAVQNYGAHGAEAGDDGLKLFFEMSGGLIVRDVDHALPEPRPETGNSYAMFATLEASPDASPEERALVESEAGPFEVLRTNFAPISGDADDRPTEEVAFYYNKSGAALEELEMTAAVEIVDPSGQPRYRTRLRGATATLKSDGTAALTAESSRTISYTGLEIADTNWAPYRDIIDGAEPIGTGHFEEALAAIQKVRAELDDGAMQALLLWHGGELEGIPFDGEGPAMLDALLAAVIDSTTTEYYACLMALPGTIDAGNDPAINGGLNRDIIRRVYGLIAEAAYLQAPPSPTIPLEYIVLMPATEPPPPNMETASQCDAVMAFGVLLDQDTAIRESANKAECSNNLKQIGIALAQQRSEYLDRVAAEFVAQIESAHPFDVDSYNDDEWLLAAKTKADILIESLGNAAETSPTLEASYNALAEQTCDAIF